MGEKRDFNYDTLFGELVYYDMCSTCGVHCQLGRLNCSGFDFHKMVHQVYLKNFPPQTDCKVFISSFEHRAKTCCQIAPGMVISLIAVACFNHCKLNLAFATRLTRCKPAGEQNGSSCQFQSFSVLSLLLLNYTAPCDLIQNVKIRFSDWDLSVFSI